MIVQSFKMHKFLIFTIPIIFIFICIILFSNFSSIATLLQQEDDDEKEEENYIKWVDFNVSYDVLDKTSKLDINSHVNNEDIKYNWIELISYLACKYGGNFDRFKKIDLDNLVAKLKNGDTIENLTKDMKYYPYYFESYTSILNQFIGEYEIETVDENGAKSFTKKYGIKAFLPIAKNYGFSHYDDFGASRSYGYKREHLGNDLMGSIGTPIIAVESGIVEAVRLESIWWMAYRY